MPLRSAKPKPSFPPFRERAGSSSVPRPEPLCLPPWFPFGGGPGASFRFLGVDARALVAFLKQLFSHAKFLAAINCRSPW
jgi:hypothetical protein